jgi:uncharacterized metal-binding protein YceD (DUF177 family)
MSEFSRLVPIARLGAEPFRQRIVASDSEREALACRFDLAGLAELAADVDLRREGDTILLHAAFEATFEQICVVALEPVAGTLAEEFSLRYGPPEAEEAVDVLAEEAAFEPLPGETIDIGEAVAQQFSLALPPFPRDPAAVIEIEPEGPPAGGPFAALERWRDEG